MALKMRENVKLEQVLLLVTYCCIIWIISASHLVDGLKKGHCHTLGGHGFGGICLWGKCPVGMKYASDYSHGCLTADTEKQSCCVKAVSCQEQRIGIRAAKCVWGQCPSGEHPERRRVFWDYGCTCTTQGGQRTCQRCCI